MRQGGGKVNVDCADYGIVIFIFIHIERSILEVVDGIQGTAAARDGVGACHGDVVVIEGCFGSTLLC